MPVGNGGGVNSVGVTGREKKFFFRQPCPPPPLPTGTLYSLQFRSHQEIKMAARRSSMIDVYDLTEK